jgi:hypothetical protein
LTVALVLVSALAGGVFAIALFAWAFTFLLKEGVRLLLMWVERAA